LRALQSGEEQMTFWKTIAGSLSASGLVATRDETPARPEYFRLPQRLKDGFIWSERMILPRPCTIRDMSPLTAQIVLWTDDVKATQIVGPLVIYSCADRKEADCTLSSRVGSTLNLRLSGPFRAPTRTYGKR